MLLVQYLKNTQSIGILEKQFKNTILKKQVKTINICKTLEFILNNDSITGSNHSSR